MKQESKRWLSRALIVAALLGVGVLVWQVSRPTGLGEGFASGNGRIEATEVDVAAKLPGRVAEIKVDEGDFVKAGEIVARMDTQVLEAQLAQAQAQVRQAENAKLTATSLVAQRESEKSTAQAVVAQRQAELTAAQKRFTRTEALVKRNALPQQQLDDDRATLQSAQAALSAARSQVISAQAAIEAGRSQVIEAQSAIEAAKASVARLQADFPGQPGATEGLPQRRDVELGHQARPAAGRRVGQVQAAGWRQVGPGVEQEDAVGGFQRRRRASVSPCDPAAVDQQPKAAGLIVEGLQHLDPGLSVAQPVIQQQRMPLVEAAVQAHADVRRVAQSL